VEKRGGVYARISNKETKTPKTEIQVQICLAMAEEDGVTVDPSHIWIDDGISASGQAIDDTTLENRPGALECLAAIERGEFDILYAVEGERLARTYFDGLRWIEASSKGGITWHLETDGVLNPSTPAGEETAVSIFASGRREGRVRSARQKRRYDTERAAGNPLWGVRPFGWEEDRITICEREASLIRSAVEDVLSNKRSMSKIAKDWTEAEVLTDGMKRERRGRDGVVRPANKAWTATTVRQLLMRDRNAGLLVHKGTVMPNSQIQPIITENQLQAIKVRVKVGTPVTQRSHSLLGGILLCECGAAMHRTVSFTQRKDKPKYVYNLYKCSATLSDTTRRHASIVQETVDRLLTAQILLDLYKGDLKSPESQNVTEGLSTVATALDEVDEEIAHVGEILLSSKFKSLHGKAEVDLRRHEARKEDLLAQRDALLARTAEGAELSAFMQEWSEGSAAFTDEADMEQWQTRFWAVWDGVSLERKRSLIRARYRPSVRVGGRGVERVQLNPVTP
jgi:site-specific DNA recombinase